jgi:ubiquitin C-terminal hydrolase
MQDNDIHNFVSNKAKHSYQISSCHYLLSQIGDTLEFPLELDMRPYMKKTVKNPFLGDLDTEIQKDKGIKARDVYKLSSVVVHEGSATFGHYVCYARPDPLNTPESWIKLNDQSVCDVTFRDVCNTAYGSNNSGKISSNAYLLFYVRVG